MCLFFEDLSDLFFFPGPSACAEFNNIMATGINRCFIELNFG
jgi:hypothetical protein